MLIVLMFKPELVGVPSILYSCVVVRSRRLGAVNVPALPPSVFSYQLKNVVSWSLVAAYETL